MRDVVILGVGMTHFGKHPELSLKDLARAAAWDAIKDAGISPKDIEYGFAANAIGGVVTGQTMVVGEVVLREVGITGIPVSYTHLDVYKRQDIITAFGNRVY